MLYLLIQPLLSRLNPFGKYLSSDSYCKCDLTQSFCDYGCCCDQDCKTQCPIGCNIKLQETSLICLPAQQYYKIGVDQSQIPECYSFTISTQVPEIDQAQFRKSYLIQNNAAVNINYKETISLQGGVQAGYQIGQHVQLSKYNQSIDIRFGMNNLIKINNSIKQGLIDDSIKVSKLGNQQVYNNQQYLSIIVNKTEGGTDTANLIMFYNYIGLKQAKVNYIGYAYLSHNFNTSTKLNITFVNITKQVENDQIVYPPFFPKFPSDIFQPIYTAQILLKAVIALALFLL